MKFVLDVQDVLLLEKENISFDPNHDYSEDEALEFAEQVRDIEVAYSQSEDAASVRKFFEYGDLADKIQNMIPED